MGYNAKVGPTPMDEWWRWRKYMTRWWQCTCLATNPPEYKKCHRCGAIQP